MTPLPRCPHCKQAVLVQAEDNGGKYLTCWTCGYNDNGLGGAEPFRIVPRNKNFEARMPM